MAKNHSHLLLTVREASILLRIHRPKVYDLIKEGIIQGFKLGSDWRIKRDSLEKLVGPIPDDFFSKKKDKFVPGTDLAQEVLGVGKLG